MSATTPQARQLGRTGLAVSHVSIGAASLGQDVEIGSPPSEAAIDAAVAMLEGPFILTDTSNSYGSGRSEAALGAAMARIGGVPNGKIVISKADRDLNTGVFDGDRVLRSFEETQARLGVEYLPVYQLHDPYTITFSEAMARGGAVEAMMKLQNQGLVGSLGIAAGPLSLVSQYVETGVFDVVLTHNRYTLLNRSAEDLIAACSSRGIGVFNAAPYGGGLLAVGTGGAHTYAYEKASPEVIRWVERLESTCAEWEVPMPAAAVQFSLRNPHVSSTLVGTANAGRMNETKQLVDISIPEAFWDDVDALGTPPAGFDGD